MRSRKSFAIFTAEKMPSTNDYGADVVVQSTADDTGLLIPKAQSATKAFFRAEVSNGRRDQCKKFYERRD
ncbi:MAG: hypothetical protein IKO74_00515 [Selenomonadaceae bacterium]|nr:hypothetical protein [Selenomonadaceae bacterium]